MQQREAFYCNEEKCINLASACAQMECRPGEGAPSGSFFLIKDAIAEDSGGEANSVCKVSTPPPPPAAPQGQGSLSLPSVSPHQLGSHRGQVPPPRCCLQCDPSCTARARRHSQETENIHGSTHFAGRAPECNGILCALFKVDLDGWRCERNSRVLRVFLWVQ